MIKNVFRGLVVFDLVARASVATYIWRSKKHFREQRRRIFFIAFCLAPVFSVPDALLAAILVIGDSSAYWLWRVLVSLLVVVLWRTWVASQRHFIADVNDFRILATSRDGASVVAGFVATRILVLWPLGVLVASVFAWGGEGGSPRSLAWIGIVLALSSVLTVAVRRISRRGDCRTYGDMSSSGGVLLKQSIRDMSPFRPENAGRYFLSLLCMTCSVSLAGSPDLKDWALELLSFGAALSAVPIRHAVGVHHRKTLETAPILQLTDYFHRLWTSRYVVGITLQIAACILLSAFLGAGGDDDAWLTSMVMSAILGAGLSAARSLGISNRFDWLICALPFIFFLTIS